MALVVNLNTRACVVAVVYQSVVQRVLGGFWGTLVFTQCL